MSEIPQWVICAPEYNGSIPPVFTSTLAWLSVQGDDFRIDCHAENEEVNYC